MLIEVFREKPTEEFLLSETESLLAEMVAEFGSLIELSQIGEPTHEGRFIELVTFKTAKPGAQAILYDGAHHSRELITIKMQFTIILKLLHGVHYSDAKTLKNLQNT